MYDGLAANSIDREWAKMAVLSYDALPAEAKSDITWMRRDGFTFQADQTSAKSGLIYRKLCGVFQTQSGATGRFLLVLSRKRATPKAPWTVAFLHKAIGQAGFSVFA